MAASRKKAAVKAVEQSPLDRFREIVGALSSEDQMTLLAEGYMFPLADLTRIDRRYGYRCRSCNEVALEFVGEHFVDSQGVSHDSPNQAFTFSEVPWVQPELEPKNWDRIHPRCQCCGKPVSIRMGRIRSELVIDIENWRASRDEAYARIRSRDGRQRFGETVQTQDGHTVSLNEPGGKVDLAQSQSQADRDFVNEVAYANDLLGSLKSGLGRRR